jgi:hypothetical protein
MQKINYILLVGIIALGLSSCASRKHSVSLRQTTTQRGQISLTLDQHHYEMGCVVKTWKNELIVLSVLPVMGIEMVRLEALPDSIIVIDKLNKQYAIVSYDEINELSPKEITFNILQSMVQQAKKEIYLEFSTNKHVLKLKGKLSKKERNAQKEPQMLNKSKYKQVTLRNLLPI